MVISGVVVITPGGVSNGTGEKRTSANMVSTKLTTRSRKQMSIMCRDTRNLRVRDMGLWGRMAGRLGSHGPVTSISSLELVDSLLVLAVVGSSGFT